MAVNVISTASIHLPVIAMFMELAKAACKVVNVLAGVKRGEVCACFG